MICNYGNQTHEILFPLKSLCSKEFGGELLSTSNTMSDWWLLFLMIAIPTIFIIMLILSYKKHDVFEVESE